MAMTLITTNTESGDATSDFTSGIDSTYKLYIFKFYDVNPATDDAEFGVQFNVAGQSGYNETITSTFFSAYLSEGGSGATIGYQAAQDQAQGTALQVLGFYIGNGADDSVKDTFQGGYFNFTAALTNVQFKMDSGDWAGTIKMWGVK